MKKMRKKSKSAASASDRAAGNQPADADVKQEHPPTASRQNSLSGKAKSADAGKAAKKAEERKKETREAANPGKDSPCVWPDCDQMWNANQGGEDIKENKLKKDLEPPAPAFSNDSPTYPNLTITKGEQAQMDKEEKERRKKEKEEWDKDSGAGL